MRKKESRARDQIPGLIGAKQPSSIKKGKDSVTEVHFGVDGNYEKYLPRLVFGVPSTVNFV